MVSALGQPSNSVAIMAATIFLTAAMVSASPAMSPIFAALPVTTKGRKVPFDENDT